MAIIIRSKHFRPSFSKPPRISTLFLQLPPSYRAFHASPQPQFLNTAIGAVHTLFEGLHSVTGLPWAYTIPLAALTIRTTLVLPISIYTRRSNQKQAALAPLVDAWQHQLRKETMNEVGHLGPAASTKTLLQKTREKRREIYSRFDCPTWKGFLPWVQLPVWLLAIETVRKMCGREAGLLGMLAARFTGEATAGNVVETGLPIEQSLATEGALWFPDLLVADPQMILPFTLSAIMLLSLSNATGKTKWQKRITRSLMVVALAIGPLTLQIPSAMLVYWISSTSLAITQGLVLDRLMPVKPPAVPCKPRRPVGIPGRDMGQEM